jgi:hypothetical protein
MGGYLHHSTRNTRFFHLCKRFVKDFGIRRGHIGPFLVCTHIKLDRADPAPHGSDQARGNTAGSQNVMNHVGNGGFSVGPRHTDHLYSTRWMTVPRIKKVRTRTSCIIREQVHHVRLIADERSMLCNNPSRSPSDGIRNKPMTVGMNTANANEHASIRRLSGIGYNSQYLIRLMPAGASQVGILT